MTVGELRKVLEAVPGDAMVVIEGGEWDYQEAQTVSVSVIEWHDEDEDDEDGHAQHDRLCLIVT